MTLPNDNPEVPKGPDELARLALADKLRRAMDEAGVSTAQLATACGVKQPSVYGWLETGRIAKRHFATFVTVLNKPLDYWFTVPPDGRLAEAKNWKNWNAEVVGNVRLRLLPVLGTAQLGDNGCWVALDYPPGGGDGFVPFISSDSDAYAVRCKGDSMAPRIQHGEFAVIEPNIEAHPGDEVLVRAIDGRVMVKTLLYKRDGRVHLRSINGASHPDITLYLDEIESIQYVAGFVKSRAWRPE